MTATIKKTTKKATKTAQSASTAKTKATSAAKGKASIKKASATKSTKTTTRTIVSKPIASASTPARVSISSAARTSTASGTRPSASAPARPAAAAAPANDVPMNFASGDYVVYPAHGVGTIEGIETQTIAGMHVTLYAIAFEKDRMRLKIPVQKAIASGLRKLSSGDRLKDALKTLKGKAKVKRTMWSRRAQEYEAKINSGDPVQIAEVLRDLRRPKDDTEQSYSERQIYQSALERLAREVAAVQSIAENKAVEHLETVLAEAA